MIKSLSKSIKTVIDVVQLLDFLPIQEHKNSYNNAMFEFLAVLKATKQNKIRTSKEIILAFPGGYSILRVKMK